MRVGKSHVRMNRELLKDIRSVETQYRFKELCIYDLSGRWKSKDWYKKIDTISDSQIDLPFWAVVSRGENTSLSGSRRPSICVREKLKCLSNVYKVHSNWCTCPSFRFKKKECKHIKEYKRIKLIYKIIENSTGEKGIARKILSYI